MCRTEICYFYRIKPRQVNVLILSPRPRLQLVQSTLVELVKASSRAEGPSVPARVGLSRYINKHT